VDLDAVAGEVHRANMTKLGLDGHPVVGNGKVLRGGFQPLDVAAVIGRLPGEAGRSACPLADLWQIAVTARTK
jgi:predicted HAD superfamily Cof-like phosphohydrolase